MTKEDSLLIAHIEDKASQCSDKQMITFSRFLDMHERSLALSVKPPVDVKRFFFGGFDDAERTVEVFLPEYIDITDDSALFSYFSDNPDDSPITVIEVKKDRFSKELTHRDYLGALMGLGIKREMTGDIKVNNDGCIMAVSSQISEYICKNFTSAGRGTLTASSVPLSSVSEAKQDTGKEESFTVSSPRLDSIVKNAFSVSRDTACDMIEHGLVFVNDSECFKSDKKISDGDKITVRHKGKLIIDDSSGISKKGRTIVRLRKFS